VGWVRVAHRVAVFGCFYFLTNPKRGASEAAELRERILPRRTPAPTTIVDYLDMGAHLSWLLEARWMLRLDGFLGNETGVLSGRGYWLDSRLGSKKCLGVVLVDMIFQVKFE
jgi:hypothetical protein